jgi:hypothetical protein
LGTNYHSNFIDAQDDVFEKLPVACGGTTFLQNLLLKNS